MADNEQIRRLRRSSDRMVAGVAGGVADYVQVDPTIVRLVFALLFILGVGITWPLVYALLWILMPEAPEGSEGEARVRTEGGADPGLIFGILLVGLGLLFLTNQFALARFIGFGAARAAWPLLLIGAGAMLFLAARDRQQR